MDGELARIAAALERIADHIELLTLPGEPPQEPVGCQHPQDSRTDFGVTGGQPDWQCKACGFRSVPT